MCRYSAKSDRIWSRISSETARLRLVLAPPRENITGAPKRTDTSARRLTIELRWTPSVPRIPTAQPQQNAYQSARRDLDRHGVLHRAVTVAERSSPSRAPISPTTSPGPRFPSTMGSDPYRSLPPLSWPATPSRDSIPLLAAAHEISSCGETSPQTSGLQASQEESQMPEPVRCPHDAICARDARGGPANGQTFVRGTDSHDDHDYRLTT